MATESELRDTKVPWLETPEELIEYISKICEENKGDYGTAVYAMSMSAIAAMRYAASVVGATGFQASCADLDIVRRSRGLDCPFAIIKANDMLYPQYSIRRKIEELLQEWTPWAKEQAFALLRDHKDHAAENVISHWMKLVRNDE